MMENNEIHNFINVWIKAILCLCYCYFIASRIPKGFFRLFSLIPIFFIFLFLPLNLHSIHLCGLTSFFLVWLCTFKLLLFSFNQGPLIPLPPNIFHFILLSSLPIKIKPNTSQKNPQKHRKSILIKLLILAAILYAYDHRETLHPRLILFLYCCHLYIGLELLLALFAAPSRAVLGLELEPQFNEPYLCTSLQDFWGRRWNLMVTSILRPTVYHPIRRRFGSAQIAVMATFLVSGLMHELIFYYFARVPPTWEVTCFFVLQGTCMVVEAAAKKAAGHCGWQLHRAVSGLVTVALLVVTGEWLFFPQIVRNGVDRKAIGEYALVVNFVKSKLDQIYIKA